MTGARLLAAAAGACAVAATWEALQAAAAGGVARAVLRGVRPLLSAGQDGRAPSSPERIRLALLGAFVTCAGGWLLAGPWTGLALGAAGPAAVREALRMRRRRWRRDLVAGAPAVARALADALAGGHSIRGAIAEAAASGGVPGAAGAELRRVAAALALGGGTGPALEGLARRAGGPEYDTLSAAVLLQRDAGGDRAGLLRSTARALEDAARVRADAHSATAQARFTAWLVAGLPLAAIALAELAQPGYLGTLLGEPLPALLTTAALVLEGTALLIVRRIAVVRW